jgi:hypothetical protein
MKEAIKLHEDWIEEAIRKRGERQTYIGQQMSHLMRSEWGEVLVEIFEAAQSNYKDAHVWAETDAERNHAKGGILAIEAIMAYLKGTALQHAEPTTDPDEMFHSSHMTVGTGEAGEI